jgi:quinoprotein glucose dehydrogenase
MIRTATIFVILGISTAVGGFTALREKPQTSAANSSAPENRDWPAYGGAPENTHYSPLAQINRNNVKQLQIAWSFDTEEEGGLQSSPIIVE